MSIETLHYDFSVCRALAVKGASQMVKPEGHPKKCKCHDCVSFNPANPYSEAVKYFHDRVFYIGSGRYFVYEKGELKIHPKDKFDINQMVDFQRLIYNFNTFYRTFF